MKKAVGYIRISSQKQVNNESSVTQRESIQRYADSNDIEIIKWFEDIAKSGKNADRDGLQDLLKYCFTNKKTIDYWVVYNMKRASRDVDTYSTEVRTVLKAMGITVRSATEPSVTDTKEGRFMENLLVMLGQLDNEGKIEVTMDNMRALALQGYYQHPPIVGYETHKLLNDIGKLRPSLKPNSMANKVRQVLERFSQGDVSKAELARCAAKIGLRSRYGKVLGEDAIHRLIKSPTYAGYVSDKFTEYELVEGRHEPIISKETYERNQSLLYPKNSRKNEVHVQKNGVYPLKGLLLCMNCKLPLYGSAPKSAGGKHSPRYHCARSSCKGKAKSVMSSAVHEDFTDMLHKIKPTGRILELYKTILIREANGRLGKLNQHIVTLREDMNRLDSIRLNTIQKFAENQITLKEKNDLMESLDQQKTKGSLELHNLEYQQSNREADINTAIDIMDKVSDQWSQSDLDLQIKFQSMLFPSGLVYDSKERKFGTTNISPLYRYITTEKASEEALKYHLVAGAGLEPATLWL